MLILEQRAYISTVIRPYYDFICRADYVIKSSYITCVQLKIIKVKPRFMEKCGTFYMQNLYRYPEIAHCTHIMLMNY